MRDTPCSALDHRGRPGQLASSLMRHESCRTRTCRAMWVPYVLGNRGSTVYIVHDMYSSPVRDSGVRADEGRARACARPRAHTYPENETDPYGSVHRIILASALTPSLHPTARSQHSSAPLAAIGAVEDRSIQSATGVVLRRHGGGELEPASRDCRATTARAL